MYMTAQHTRMGYIVILKEHLILYYYNFIKYLKYLLNKKFLDHPQDDQETLYQLLTIIY